MAKRKTAAVGDADRRRMKPADSPGNDPAIGGKTARRDRPKFNLDAARAAEFERLDRVEREAWEAWDRSRGIGEGDSPDDTNDATSSRSAKCRGGDPRFLSQILHCMAARRTLLGLDSAPPTSEFKNEDPPSRRARIVALFALLCDRRGTADRGATLGDSQSRGAGGDVEPRQLAAGESPAIS